MATTPVTGGAADVKDLEAILCRFKTTVDDTAARISRVQTRLKKTGEDVGALTGGGERQVLGALTMPSANAVVASSSSFSPSSSASATIAATTDADGDKENTSVSQWRIQQLEDAYRALVAEAAADKKRCENEARGLREKVYALRAQLISHSSGSYRRSMDAMQERRVKLSSPASVATDAESVSDNGDHERDLDHTTPDPAARRRSGDSTGSKHKHKESADTEQLRAQLDAARLDASRAHDVSREILRRYQAETAAAKKENEGLRRELALARAQAASSRPHGELENEVAACRGALEHVRGDVAWLQFVAAEYKVQLSACLITPGREPPADNMENKIAEH